MHGVLRLENRSPVPPFIHCLLRRWVGSRGKAGSRPVVRIGTGSHCANLVPSSWAAPGPCPNNKGTSSRHVWGLPRSPADEHTRPSWAPIDSPQAGTEARWT